MVSWPWRPGREHPLSPSRSEARRRAVVALVSWLLFVVATVVALPPAPRATASVSPAYKTRRHLVRPRVSTSHRLTPSRTENRRHDIASGPPHQDVHAHQRRAAGARRPNGRDGAVQGLAAVSRRERVEELPLAVRRGGLRVDKYLVSPPSPPLSPNADSLSQPGPVPRRSTTSSPSPRPARRRAYSSCTANAARSRPWERRRTAPWAR